MKIKQSNSCGMCVRWALLCAAVLLLLGGPALAGPPLICHAIDIGAAESLPWSSSGWNLTGAESYDTASLVADTLKLLGPNTSVLARMETMRRATLYAQGKKGIGAQLLAKLEWRTKENPKDALAAFDYGYLVETYKQANWLAQNTNWLKSSPGWRGAELGAAEKVDGYAQVERAIALRGGDAEMEFAAALMTKEGADAERAKHVKSAMAGAKTDPLLARNLTNRFPKEMA